MRIGLIADIHAVSLPLEVVLSDLAREAPDEVVCLGDATDLGPQPRETLARLREVCGVWVRGNHDPLDEVHENPVLEDIQEWTRDRLTGDERAFLAGLPLEHCLVVDGVRLLCTHGSPRAVDDGVLPDVSQGSLEALCADHPCDVLACGHTHIPMVRRAGATLVVNPGSVGMPFVRPFDGSPPKLLPWAEYGLLEIHAGRVSVELRRAPIATGAVRNAVLSSGMPHASHWAEQWPG